MDEKTTGVITEQGFVAGDFGFSPISESEKEKIENTETDNK